MQAGVFHGAEVGGEGSNDEPVLGPQYQDGFVIRDGLAGSAVDDAVIANPVFAFLDWSIRPSSKPVSRI